MQEEKMTLRPIKSEADYHSALAEIERLFMAEPGTSEGDRLDIMATLVEVYEDQHYPMPPPDPVSALEYYLECRGLTRHDLEPYLGSRTRVNAILDRRSALTIDMIRKLHEGLKIPAEVLIQPYPLLKAAA